MVLKEADGRKADLIDLKALREELAPRDQTIVDHEIRCIERGIAGESSAAHFLNREFGKSENVGILHDLRFCVGDDVAQIDHLVIHRVQQTAWVLESKNFSGRLDCDEQGDWTVWYGRKPKAIPSPINQARRQLILLRDWLAANSITTIRKIEPVVLISPRSSINRRHLKADDHVVKSDNFAQWWSNRNDAIGLGRALAMVGRHLANGMSPDDLVELGHKLCEAHTPLTRDWRKSLRLSAAASNAKPILTPCETAPWSRVIETSQGKITITKLPDGRLALRSEPNPELIDAIKGSCKGRARWNPRFRNWVFENEALELILARIERRLARNC